MIKIVGSIPDNKHPAHGGDEIKYSKEEHYKPSSNHELVDQNEDFPSLNDDSTGLNYRQRINPNRRII